MAAANSHRGSNNHFVVQLLGDNRQRRCGDKREDRGREHRSYQCGRWRVSGERQHTEGRGNFGSWRQRDYHIIGQHTNFHLERSRVERLDMAYDEGGVGARRTITADNGAVEAANTDGFQVMNESVLFTGMTVTVPAPGAGTRFMW